MSEDLPPPDDEPPPSDDEAPPDLPPPTRSKARGKAGRVPPSNEDAERAVLGALLLAPITTIGEAAEILPGADVFYRPAHGHIYAAIMAIASRGETPDPITVADQLRRHDLLDQAGGTNTLVDLQADAPGTANVGHYARIVRDHAMLRRLIGAGENMAQRAYDIPQDVRGLVDEAEAMVFDIARHEGAGSAKSIGDLAGMGLNHIEMLQERTSDVTGTATGFYDLDDITGGLQPGSLIILGARPAMGKTAFALSIAANAALRHDHNVMFFSLEMTHLELSMRLLSSESRVPSNKLKRRGGLSDRDWGALATSIGALGEADQRLILDDQASITPLAIRSKARRHVAEHGRLDLIIIDYVQLLVPRGGAENRQVEISEMSRALKLLARELECPVIALAQLNRGLEQRSDKRPMLSDLRESGSLEADADIVAFLYRDEVYSPTPDNQGLAELIIAKQRSGPTGTVPLLFMPHITRFQSIERETM